MQHYTESSIEMYLLQPEALPEIDKEQIARHLESCQACNEILTSLRDFYARLQEKRKAAVAPKVWKFLDGLFQNEARTIPLVPFKADVQATFGKVSFPQVLAAKSPDRQKKIFKTVAVFAAQQEDILVRITGDREAGKFRLALKAGEPANYRKAKVFFPELALQIPVDINSSTTFTLLSEDRERNFEQLECFLSFTSEPAGGRNMAEESSA